VPRLPRPTPREPRVARLARLRAALVGAAGLFHVACAPGHAPFPLRAPVLRDQDLDAVRVACVRRPDHGDLRHVSCAPAPSDVPQIWTPLDHMVFRPISDTFSVRVSGEAANVNSLDEVPDSAWFTNRGAATGIATSTCDPSRILDPTRSADGTWVIDRGKTTGATPGFRVTVPKRGKYMFKADTPDQPEVPTAASVVGAAIYRAAGFNTACEQIVYFPPSLLKLSPGLRYRHSVAEDPKPFDERALQHVLDGAARRGPLVRMHASAWIPGYLLGPFRYDGTRSDDPSDVIPHEDRRDLRGARLIAAWIDHVDARDANSMDAWVAEGAVPDGSPGHVVHYYLDTSDAFGPDFGPILTPRMGFSYTLDWSDMAEDLLTLGVLRRPWFAGAGDPGFSVFRGFDVHSFVPSEWKMQYENPAFSRMTERDGAWMARILARFSREQVRALAQMAELTDPKNTEHLETVLEGRLERILARYLTRLAPIGELHVEARDRLCGLDLAQMRAVREPASFRFTARWSPGAASPDDGRRARGLRVEASGAGRVCVDLPRVAPDAGPRDDSPQRYVTVHVDDGVAQGPLVAYLYDLGPARGYVLAGIDRPEG